MNAVVTAALRLGLACAQQEPAPADAQRDVEPVAAAQLAAPAHAPPPLVPFVDADLAVVGYRARAELVAALQQARPRLDACEGDADGALVIDFTVYGKGAVDRAVVLYDDDAIDDACAVDVVRALAFADRGKEPPTRFVLRLVRGESAVLPLDTVQRALDERAFSIARCMNDGAADQHGVRAAALRFDVDEDGRARNVQVSSAELGGGLDETLRGCAAAAVGEAEFAGGPGVGVWSVHIKPRAPLPVRAMEQAEHQTLADFVRALPCFP